MCGPRVEILNLVWVDDFIINQKKKIVGSLDAFLWATETRQFFHIFTNASGASLYKISPQEMASNYSLTHVIMDEKIIFQCHRKLNVLNFKMLCLEYSTVLKRNTIFFSII